MALRPRVYTARDVAADPSVTEDSYLTKLVKYIPSEIVAAYVALSRAIAAEGSLNQRKTLLWIVSAALVVLAFAWVLAAASEPRRPRPYFQASTAAIAFACWVFALGGPFEFYAWYKPVYGTVVLVLATLLVPLLEKVFLGQPQELKPKEA